MSNVNSNKSKVTLNVKDLSLLIGDISSEVYGIVGLTKAKTFKNQLIILKKENYVEGVLPTKLINGMFDVEIHLILAYGVKVTEVVNELSKRIRYEVTKRHGRQINKMNIYVEDFLDL